MNALPVWVLAAPRRVLWVRVPLSHWLLRARSNSGSGGPGPQVNRYYINYRQLDAEDPQDYTVATATHGPFILEGLQSDARYEVFLEAINSHGPGEPSSRVVFKTRSKVSNREVVPCFRSHEAEPP